METEVSALAKQRAVIKAKLTRFKNFINNFDQERGDIEDLCNRFERFKGLETQFDEVQSRIECLAEISEQSEEEREEFDDSFYKCMAMANRFMKTKATQQVNIVQHRARLPEIQIPTFDGKFDEWLAFRDIYQSLVHSNETLSNVDKFRYLKSSLRNEALRVISSLDICESNYEIAWAKITNRYEDKEGIIAKHVKHLFELEPITRESFTALRQLADDFSNHIEAIKSLDNVSNIETRLLTYLIMSKMDNKTRREWETVVATQTAPSVDFMLQFIIDKSKILEKVIPDNISAEKISGRLNHKSHKKATISYMTVQKPICTFCKKEHKIHACESFVSLTVPERVSEAKRLSLCFNCLSRGHSAQECRSQGTCRKCHKRHHTLLHLDNSQQVKTHEIPKTSSATPLLSNYSQVESASLLATAAVQVANFKGKYESVRLILDSGSQTNFITDEMCNKLNLPRKKVCVPIMGVNQSRSRVKHSTVIKLKSRVTQFEAEFTCLVIDKLIDKLPCVMINRSQLKIPKHVKLADPNFHIPSKVDLLIGSNLFWGLLANEQIKVPNSSFILQATKLGFVVAGNQNDYIPHIKCNIATVEKIHVQLEKFWEQEKCDSAKVILSREQRICEAHYVKTARRLETGQYSVSIPFKANVSELGYSYQTALKRFHSLEAKLKRNPQLKTQYVSFMREYKSLGHMTELKNGDVNDGYFLPHHGVFNYNSETSKLRVVFNASAKTTSGLSLNDVQMTGPPLQNDIFNILLRFRQHKYVVKADITKMYRQILIQPNERKFQKILWRKCQRDPLRIFQLNTVTYGTASAPYLAIRTIKQVAEESTNKAPAISKIIESDLYVDDLLTGAETIHEAAKIKNDITRVFAEYGFEWHKWQSNCSHVVENTDHQVTPGLLISKEREAKTLGIHWDSSADTLHYALSVEQNKNTTKRIMLSVIAAIFDPLGLLGPVVIHAKIILQHVWQTSLGWDEPVSTNLEQEWVEFINGLTDVNTIMVPRRVLCDNHEYIEFHGFSDASEAAYGACIYILSKDNKRHASVNLLCAKSRVAPLKRLSLPRLELCGALLLARLYRMVKSSLSITPCRTILWTDSTITLSWVRGCPTRWKQFVSHRVSEIQEETGEGNWRHVPTQENPADLLSRGTTPHGLIRSKLWWHGPTFLKTAEHLWPNLTHDTHESMPEMRSTLHCHTICVPEEEFQLVTKFSCYLNLVRVTAYIFRFVHNCKSSRSHNKMIGELTPDEVSNAELRLIKCIQKTAFNREMSQLMNDRPVNRTSRLLSLSPFCDKDGILRAGGRIHNSPYSFEHRHPAILPSKHHVTELIIRHEHVKLMHAGVEGTLAAIRSRFWITAGRSSVKRVIRKCIVCVRTKPRFRAPLMGDVPSFRLTPCRPFLKTGVDYAGPFNILDGYHKRAKLNKVYLALFVCMVTKVVHIEIVHNLTTDSFLATLHRFIARRRMPSDIYSDNGKNFVGANNELRNLKSLFETAIDGNKITKSLAINSIRWHFNPPRSPHMGGIWEASVKSLKSHLKRVIANANLRGEVFATLVTQIEAILNSRPLTPLSNDPNDLSCLTPSHFLIGDVLLTPPLPDVRHIQENRLSHWQHIQKLRQHFWSRWSKEYISLLQQRQKWKLPADNLKLGQIVLIKDEHLPPLQWLMGRVIDLHPGADDIIRVVTIKTAHGTLKRAVHNVCVLPLESEQVNAK